MPQSIRLVPFKSTSQHCKNFDGFTYLFLTRGTTGTPYIDLEGKHFLNDSQIDEWNVFLRLRRDIIGYGRISPLFHFHLDNNSDEKLHIT